jgi:hypothetical protein
VTEIAAPVSVLLFLTIPAVIATMVAPSFMIRDNEKELFKKNFPAVVSGALFFFSTGRPNFLAF